MYALLYAVDPQLTASDVLRVFHRDEPYLFLGAAFTTTAILAAAFSLVRRKLDPLLIYFALFAFLYGQRLWIQSGLLALLIPPHSEVFLRLRDAMEFVVPIPAFLFFEAAGLLHRGGRLVGYLLGAILGSLALVTLVFGASRIYHLINNVVVIAVLILLVVQHVLVMLADRTGSTASSSVSRDFAIIRRGFFVFAALAMFDNFALFFGLRSKVEPYGFVVFLGALGYVAARQTLERDQQLGEIQKELEVAKRIQLSILPGVFPSSLNFRVAARYVPMTSVAGDFYDFLVANDTQAGLLIADVSGHGVPAALIASMVKLAATSQRSNAAHPASLLTGMNSALCGNTQSQFVTAAYVHLDAETQELRYSAAGHPPMLLLRNGKAFEIEENGLMLAAFDFATYTNAAQPLHRGDRLLLYTDGIVEAANAAGDFFGADALRVVLQKTAKLSPSETADSIIATIRQWSATQDDDWTVLVCDYAADSLPA